MSLFDMLKEKASELLGGATDKVTEMTGFESPADAVGGVTEAGQGVVDSATGVIGDASGAVTDVTGSITDNLPGSK
ncbi:hypothetical protein [Amycolatopsis sp.]|jgi:hypothetical protein|uniref:hypothetical protein n=1 Tax=Amycolatopsis sp. TaxID=37632 RepID=UPI002DF99796|nr:hypothetical protein [Amycolatopsis sp.]